MARPASDIKERVIHAARTRFLEQGVDGASLRDIAKAARTSIGMIYYYFPTKDDLFLSVVEEVYSKLLEELTPALDPAASVEERILRLYTRVSRVTEDERLVLRLVLREALISSARLDRIIERFQRGHLPLLFRLVMDGVADGTFDAKIHPLVIFVSLMALGGPGQLMHRVVGGRTPLPDVPSGPALSRQMLDIFLNGVGSKAERGDS